jgi:transcription termination factor Rho
VLIVLLIDERPEEVTDMEENVKANFCSPSTSRPPDKLADMAVIEKAKRLVEHGRDVVILLIRSPVWPGLTWSCPSGKILSRAAWTPTPCRSRSGSSARRASGGPQHHRHRPDRHRQPHGQVTSSSRERATRAVLDRRLADRRIYRDRHQRTSTRKERLLADKDDSQRVYLLRNFRHAVGGGPQIHAGANEADEEQQGVLRHDGPMTA